MLPINKKITTFNFTNSNRSKSAIKYIVIHYVGAVSTAKNNVDYFAKAYVGASAHYFVDEKEIWQSVEDKDIGWHCGTTGTYKHPSCRNSNSIGIEMCVKKTSSGKWYFEDATVKNTIELVKYLKDMYDVPDENIIRHYDVTGKTCPEPYVSNTTAWSDFKSKIRTTTTTEPNNPPIQLVGVEKYEVVTNIAGYNTASDAISKTNQRTTITPKTYYIYRKYSNGAINITTDATGKSPGSWINPEHNKIPVALVGEYEVIKNISGFNTAQDALNGTNKQRTITKGKYYVYKTYTNGCINITSDKTAKTPGSWINPKHNVSVVVPGDTYVVEKSISGHNTAADAKNNVNAKSTLKPGTYYVYKIQPDGSLNLTTDATVKSPGWWVYPR